MYMYIHALPISWPFNYELMPNSVLARKCMFHPTLWDTVHAQIMYQYVSGYKSDAIVQGHKIVCSGQSCSI